MLTPKDQIFGRWSPALVGFMTLTGILVLTVRVAEAIPAGGPPVWLDLAARHEDRVIDKI